MSNTQIPIPEDLRQILDSLPKAYLVGGCVRDHFLGLVPKDFDIEIYGTDYEQLTSQLQSFGRVDIVGKSFGVIKLTLPSGETHDFSLPRRESKVAGGSGHKAFAIEFDPTITEKEGATRRDLTINALMWNSRTGEVLDFFGGLTDLQNKIIRHTSGQFAEDPLRALRIFQFASRFEFEVAPETAALCRSIAGEFSTLAPERVSEEFNKFLLKGKNHVLGFKVLSEIGWLQNFPALAALERLPQEPLYHPEGDVLTHTGHCLTAMTKLPAWRALSTPEKLVYSYGILCHDLGKATTTKVEFKKALGRDAIVSPGHDIAGVEPARILLTSLKAPLDLIARVLPLVAHHMDHLQVKTDARIRQLAVQMKPESIQGLSLVVEADHSGRPPLAPEQPAQMQHILDRAMALNCDRKPQLPHLTGADVLNAVLKPGRLIGIILDKAYEAQIAGHINSAEEARQWLKDHRSVIIENSRLGPERLLSGKALKEAGMPTDGNFQKVHRATYEQQLDGNPTSLEQVIAYIEENAALFSVPPEVIQNLKKHCA